MAEAILNRKAGPPNFAAYRAGSHPSGGGYVLPLRSLKQIDLPSLRPRPPQQDLG